MSEQVRRPDDGSSFGSMTIFFAEDNDIEVHLVGADPANGGRQEACVDFPHPGAGGRSPITYKGLSLLAELMHLDNAG